ncbi:hypothetical protein C7460_11431 [Marinoscillum furvescens DSM 4134]|uniref:Uncharacterized protein n=2 Tax=Marinoscillum furvescens TaxID=1026 RepID=A0A3D9L0M4_MARFU|nr:hypothetical protein C7460_11431 [Marinoscillum furvescens DSM 4134]
MNLRVLVVLFFALSSLGSFGQHTGFLYLEKSSRYKQLNPKWILQVSDEQYDYIAPVVVRADHLLVQGKQLDVENIVRISYLRPSNSVLAMKAIGLVVAGAGVAFGIQKMVKEDPEANYVGELSIAVVGLGLYSGAQAFGGNGKLENFTRDEFQFRLLDYQIN